jgi:hypothetical protein
MDAAMGVEARRGWSKLALPAAVTMTVLSASRSATTATDSTPPPARKALDSRT